MSDNNTTPVPATDFIRNIIREDLASGKHQQIVTRFPPEPNGHLHIGHAKSIHLNFGVAKEFDGKCFMRFDDTNPVKEDEEYVEGILKDVSWLGYDWSKSLTHASDYFEQLYEFAEELIQKDKAYVESLNAEEISAAVGDPKVGYIAHVLGDHAGQAGQAARLVRDHGVNPAHIDAQCLRIQVPAHVNPVVPLLGQIGQLGAIDGMNINTLARIDDANNALAWQGMATFRIVNGQPRSQAKNRNRILCS